MTFPLSTLSPSVTLLPGEPMLHRDRNRDYLNRLKPENLLISHYLEAGLRAFTYPPEGLHWGWDAVTSDIRGTLVGHWLSAAARIYAETQDQALKLKADAIVAEIGRCQQENGGEWAFPIPEKYLHWLKRGKRKWAPQYVCHKNMMGLLDMYLYAGNQQALEIDLKCADWFYRFTADITREQMSEMMDFEETGGMMEHWANLYAVTHDPRHLELMRRYERPHLFDPLERGEDVLTNMHANSSIPEVQGAARAYEVTGEVRYRRIVENYWDLAIRQRGTYATGGQTCGEIWPPLGEQSARLGEMNQEHCTVYNMMRLAEYLLRWTGDAEYADFYERNLYNGILAQGYWQGRSRDTLCDPRTPPTGLIAYFLPMQPGAQKKWGSELEHFWCCHCTLLQANSILNEGIYYQSEEGVTVCQYFPSRLTLDLDGAHIRLEQSIDPQTGENFRILPINRELPRRPQSQQMLLKIQAGHPVDFTLRLRRPWWLKGALQVSVNGQPAAWTDDGHGFAALRRTWENDEVRVSLPYGLTCWPLPDRPDTVAFLHGPVVLAGLVGEERTLYGDIADPATLLIPDDEREWQTWKTGWRTVDQPVGWRFKPLYEIGHEVYTLYFPVKKGSPPNIGQVGLERDQQG
jgi:uncharacterized protein